MRQAILFLLIAFSMNAYAQQYPPVTIPGSEIRRITSSIVAGQEYELHILLPGGYRNSSKIYPVVYLMDSQWDFPLVKSIYGEHYYDGFIPEMIIVGVTWGGTNPNPDSLRARDYTPTNIGQVPQSGGADKFLSFMKDELFPFMDYNYIPSESNWAMLRESQMKSLSVPNTAMAVAIDLGEWNDIHPDNKKEVGDRLALAAQKMLFGENIVYSGPIYQSSTVNGDKITISFTNTGTGLTTCDGEELSEFAIAGDDGKYVWAKAKIEGDKVVVWNDAIKNPKYVRYAWADNPVNPNLFNKEGLPASPFRTDK